MSRYVFTIHDSSAEAEAALARFLAADKFYPGEEPAVEGRCVTIADVPARAAAEEATRRKVQAEQLRAIRRSGGRVPGLAGDDGGGDFAGPSAQDLAKKQAAAEHRRQIEREEEERRSPARGHRGLTYRYRRGLS